MDHHCTLKSKSPEDVTRFGTSTQLTQQGVKAVDRFWRKGGPRDILKTYDDRVEAARARPRKAH